MQLDLFFALGGDDIPLGAWGSKFIVKLAQSSYLMSLFTGNLRKQMNSPLCIVFLLKRVRGLLGSSGG
jgi:hypothetical protein